MSPKETLMSEPKSQSTKDCGKILHNLLGFGQCVTQTKDVLLHNLLNRERFVG